MTFLTVLTNPPVNRVFCTPHMFTDLPSNISVVTPELPESGPLKLQTYKFTNFLCDVVARLRFAV